MAMGTLSETSDDDFNPEINTTPLVDVMLVLLIIFIITIPVINHSVKLNLPQASSQPNKVQPETVNLAIDAAGQLFWNNKAINAEMLTQNIARAAQQTPQPELHLRAERTTQYEKIAQVMSAAQTGGLTKIGFITDPKNR
ncbi:MAG: biopolymer transporter ExbD [Burkholderiaceae bacterium]